MAMRAALEMLARRHADLHRQFGGHRPLVGAPANAVGAEICPAHRPCPPSGEALMLPIAIFVRLSSKDRPSPCKWTDSPQRSTHFPARSACRRSEERRVGK